MSNTRTGTWYKRPKGYVPYPSEPTQMIQGWERLLKRDSKVKGQRGFCEGLEYCLIDYKRFIPHELMRWLPISSAPKSGEYIVVATPRHPQLAIVQWEGGQWADVTNRIHEPTHWHPTLYFDGNYGP